MTQKKKLVKAYIPPELADRLNAAAEREGLSASSFVRLMIEAVVGLEEDKSPRPTKARREGKVTVRLGQEVRQALEREAKSQHVPVSTWASRLLTARVRSAPQPVTGERKVIQAAFRQLRGMATNLNQMATVMNRGVFTGDSYAPTKDEMQAMRLEVQALRTELAKYASGRFTFQTGEGAGSE
ncbi:plasmid mobilization relaxosome protein MobC [Roseovarius aestuarii]|uniref:Ribbon-helix-helix protein, copG family n=1 Tax=Roseovarius aestuarii TaxID=475083 RepID=A0A1X7BY16_9RHOB|nr:plasmid mobilization relaxosome protein MobC [Roseovarius aestuarii]SMC14390.1 Ribbon-helix-helix protein, copG family [Roseovarius aestuarii]